MKNSDIRSNDMLTTDPNSLNGLGELYQEIILEHAKRPRHRHQPNTCSFCESGKNPLCGDTITLYGQVHSPFSEKNDPKISMFFEGSGCSISQASASILCQTIQNMTATEARKWLQQAEDLISGQQRVSEEDLEEDLHALSGVSKFPVRVKCAALAWKTLKFMLDEHFDFDGKLKPEDSLCDALNSCKQKPKLKLIKTQNN